MRKFTPRVVRVTALTAAAAFALLPMAAASAATSNATAFGIKASVLGVINVGPLPTSTFPDGADTSLANANLGTLGTVAAVRAKTSGDLTAGTSAALGSATNIALLLNAVPGFPAVSADLIQADCTDNAPAPPTGQSTFTNASIAGNPIVNIHPAPNTALVSANPLLTITLNEQTTTNGKLTVNAVHIVLLSGLPGGASLADVIIGQATCGPNAAVLPVAAFSFQDLPVILAGIALLVAAGFGIRVGARRLRSAA